MAHDPDSMAWYGEEHQLATEVLRYLREHPGAMDTAKGIADFWLGVDGRKVEARMLTKVLHELATLGLLEEVRHADKLLYRLQPTPAGQAGEVTRH